MAQVLTHSRTACFRDCPRKHFLRYELGIRRDTESLPIKIGSAFHDALDRTDRGLDPLEPILALDDPYDAHLALAMYVGHVDRYADEPLTVIASEQEFNLPLINPDTGKPTPIWRFSGKIDRIVKLDDGRLALMEYKTTSRDFSPGAEYWLRLHMDMQLSIYVIAARAMGYDVETVLYDVTRRPAKRPLKATPTESRKYKKDGTLYANQRDTDETPDEYGARLAADIKEKPDHYFARIEIARLEQDLDDCRAELWQQQLAIREAQRSGRWYKNPGSCYGFFPCDYLPICLNRDLEMVTPDGYIRAENVHPELDDATSEG